MFLLNRHSRCQSLRAQQCESTNSRDLRKTWRTTLAAVTCACLLVMLFGPCTAASIDVGTKAPFFSVKSGDGKELTLDMLKGKVAVIFYESKEVVEKNRGLKNALNKLERDKIIPADRSMGVAIVDCSGAFWPFTRIWKGKLKENSKKEGLTIYGDWDGKMARAYSMNRNESNVVLIDADGVVSYFHAGKIDDGGINRIEQLLKQMTAGTQEPDPNAEENGQKPL